MSTNKTVLSVKQHKGTERAAYLIHAVLLIRMVGNFII